MYGISVLNAIVILLLQIIIQRAISASGEPVMLKLSNLEQVYMDQLEGRGHDNPLREVRAMHALAQISASSSSPASSSNLSTNSLEPASAAGRYPQPMVVLVEASYHRNESDEDIHVSVVLSFVDKLFIYVDEISLVFHFCECCLSFKMKFLAGLFQQIVFCVVLAISTFL
jgi:hypothetical protein